MRFSTRRRHSHARDGRVVVGGRFFVDYLAITNRTGNGHTGKSRATRRYDVINLELFKDPPPESPSEQMAMALALLEMCESRGVTFRTTRGSLASAMLKASPHWQKGRHGAARFVNEHARPYLPGNFYSISNKVRRVATKSVGLGIMDHCYYVDQTSAHHNIVRSTALPHPEDIRARGYYKKVLKGEHDYNYYEQKHYKIWAKPESQTGQAILSGRLNGLVFAKVGVGHNAPTIEHLYPPWALKQGVRYVWLWTPELRLFRGDHRLQLEGFVCGFLSREADDVLPEYATWALSQVQRGPTATYTKSTLLAAYGMLAFNPDGKPLYRYWGGQNSRERVLIPDAGLVAESKIELPPDVQPATVNVIARGCIESETRTRSIEYARLLTSEGFHIPQIYADGILVETTQLPFVPNGWRVSHSLTNVMIPRPNAILSDQLTKLPGVTQGNIETERWLEMRQQALSPVVSVGSARIVAA